jgi:hypothetical protein
MNKQWIFERNAIRKAMFFFAAVLCITTASAQTNVYWPLTSNGNPTSTGYLTGSTIVPGGGIGPIAYGANGVYSNNWIEVDLAAAITANDYYQYSMTATANVSLTDVSLYVMANQPNGSAVIMYLSVGGGPFQQVSGVVALPNNVLTLLTASGLNLSVLNGQTVSFRVYGWGMNAANKLIYNRDVLITGYWSNTNDYFRTFASGDWNDINSWESSPDGTEWFHASLYPTAAANTVYIESGHVVTLTDAAACGDLTFNGGSITLDNYDLTINGTLSGIPYYTYSGTGVPSQTGTVSHVTVTYPAPISLPAELNTLIIDSGAGNTVLMPNSVITTNLEFDSGDLALNGYTLTLAEEDFAVSSDDAVLSALDVSVSNTANAWFASTSIARTWTTSGTFTDNLSVHLTYPETESSSATMKVWVRDEGDDGPWILIGTYATVDNGDTRTITIPGVTTINGSLTANLQWTISEIDQTLPVELSTFLAYVTPQNYIMLEWVTQSETDVSGFYIYRSMYNELTTADRINIFIDATNTSLETSYIFTDREAVPGHTWYYWLQHIELSGEIVFHGPVSIFLAATNDFVPPIPLTTGLNDVYPNPFNPPANISYGLNKASTVSLVVINSRGEVVRNLYSGSRDAGNYRVQWNGKNDRGVSVSSGVYFIRMIAGKTTSTKKVVLIK